MIARADLVLLVRAAVAFKSYVHLQSQNRGGLPSPLSLFLVGSDLDEAKIIAQQEALEVAVERGRSAFSSKTNA